MNGTMADIIGAYITGERWMAKDTGQKRPTREAVPSLVITCTSFGAARMGMTSMIG